MPRWKKHLFNSPKHDYHMNLSVLFKQEWIKLQSSRSLIFFIICLLMQLGMAFGTFVALSLPPPVGTPFPDLQLVNPFSEFLSKYSQTLAFIASLFFIIQYGDEYKHGMIRKNIIDGMDRRDIFNGKMIFLFASYLAWTVIMVFVFFTAGIFQTGDHFGELLASMQPEQLVKYYLHVIFYGAFAFFLVSTSRSATISITVFFAILIADQLAQVALVLLKLEEAANYLPVNVATVMRMVDDLSNRDIVVYVAYLIAFFGIGQWMIYKRDL